MSTYDGKEYFDKLTVAQYLNMIGLDESEIKSSRLKRIKGMKLEFLSELYELTDAESILLDSSREVGTSFELLISQLNNELLYETKEEKEFAMSSALSIISRVSCIQVSDGELDAYEIFERTNNLLNTIIGGIVCTDNITHLEMLYNNLPPTTLLTLGKNKDLPDDVRKLYDLMALSKFKDSKIDHEIFDEFDKVNEKRLRRTVETLLYDEVEVETQKDRDNEFVPKNKTLAFQRPTFKQLKEIGDYRRM